MVNALLIAKFSRFLKSKSWDFGQELPGLRETDSPVVGPLHSKGGAAPVIKIERTNNALHALIQAITTAGSIYFGNINGTKWGVGATGNLDSANWLEVDAAGAKTSVTHTVKELVVDGFAGVRGVHIKKSSDVHSGRVFWQSQDKTFLAYLENSTGELRFYSGGTYGSATGTLAHRFMPNGDVYHYGELTTVGAATIGGSMFVGADLDGPAEFAVTNGLGETIFFSNTANETQLLAGGTARVIAGVGYVDLPPAYTGTTASAANLNVVSGGRLARSTSAAKYKRDFTRLDEDRIERFRQLVGGTYKSLCERDDPEEIFSGIIADQAHDLGLSDLVSYGDDGAVEGFRYERAVAYLIEDNKQLRSIVAELTKRVDALS